MAFESTNETEFNNKTETETKSEINNVIEFRLTTFDNPYNPFTEFDQWFLFDVERGYNTCGYLARMVDTPDELTEQESTIEINRAIDDIIKNDFLNIYRRVTKDDAIVTSNIELQ